MNMILLGILAEDKTISDFAIPGHEVTFYNHTYHDGLNGEGAPNYMAMPCGYFLPYLAKPDGWLRFQPNFVKDNPFYNTAVKQLNRLQTVRGLHVEFGDQHIHAYHPYMKKGTMHGRDKKLNEQNHSMNWASFGVGILRVGKPDHRMELGMDYTRATLHNSQDALSMECWVDGVPVMRRGGYSPWWINVPIQRERPEFKALAAMDYPHKIFKCSKNGFKSWSWAYAHSPLCQNTVMVDGIGTGPGWSNNRGYGEVITFKGGEASGTPGSDFQVLDVLDHYSWQQVKQKVPEFRRTIIALETADGRPYALDILKLRGGEDHTLFNSAWAERVSSKLPAPTSIAENLGQIIPNGSKHEYYKYIRDAKKLKPGNTPWEVTWKTDFAAYAPRPVDGKPFVRPLPENEGKVRLRIFGFDQGSAPLQLVSVKGPWLAHLRQRLPGGISTNGVVGFENARDFVIERRQGKALDSLFIHLIEGFLEGESSVIKSAKQLKTEDLKGGKRDIAAIQLKLTDGNTDTVIYQSEPGTIRLPDGLETDARYALIRTDKSGKVVKIESCRSTFVNGKGLNQQFPGDYTGEIVDIIGDLTGNRRESALIIKTDKSWPTGTALKGRQLLVKFASSLRKPCNEGYRIDKVTALSEGKVRVDLLDHPPFITSWHDVHDLPAPGKVRTIRPMVSHGNSPWYFGMNLWFPEKKSALHHRQNSHNRRRGRRGNSGTCRQTGSSKGRNQTGATGLSYTVFVPA